MKVLLVDADPQGSVGLSLTRHTKNLRGFFDFLGEEEADLESVVVKTRLETMHIVPAGQGSNYDMNEGYAGSAEADVERFLDAAAAADYDMCVVDTAAGMFGVTRDVLSHVGAVIVPQQAEPLGIRSMPKMLNALRAMRQVNPSLNVLGVLLTMVQANLPESLESSAAIREMLPESLVFKREIPRDGMVIRASSRGLPVGVLNENGLLIDVFDGICDEILTKLGD